jgi:DMSO reductase anchor subunit
LVWLTLLTQVAVGASATATGTAERTIAAIAAVAALGASLLHLGRPVHAWKALRNLRRSWLSREVAAFGAYGGLAALAVVAPVAAVGAVLVGAVGVFASGRLYVVPGRPGWHSWLTIVRFGATAVILGPLLTGHPAVALWGIVLQATATVANLVRLGRGNRIEQWGVVRLTLGWFRIPSVGVAVGWMAGAGLILAGHPWVALPVLALAELVGRYLFYVTVVPLDMPGSFSRASKKHA